MESIYYGISTIIGIVIGVIVTVGADYLKACIQYKKDLTVIKHEFSNDIHKIDGWLGSIRDLKDKINGNRIYDYTGYLNCSSVIFATSIKLFNQGLLYKKLSYDDIESLQKCWNFLSLYQETTINNSINNYRNSLNNPMIQVDNVGFMRQVDYWKNMLNDCKKTLENINKKI